MAIISCKRCPPEDANSVYTAITVGCVRLRLKVTDLDSQSASMLMPSNRDQKDAWLRCLHAGKEQTNISLRMVTHDRLTYHDDIVAVHLY